MCKAKDQVPPRWLLSHPHKRCATLVAERLTRRWVALCAAWPKTVTSHSALFNGRLRLKEQEQKRHALERVASRISHLAFAFAFQDLPRHLTAGYDTTRKVKGMNAKAKYQGCPGGPLNENQRD